MRPSITILLAAATALPVQAASLKPGSATFREIGDAVKITVSVNLDEDDIGAIIGFSLIEDDIFFDDPLGSRLRTFEEDDVVVTDGLIMVIDHMLLFSNASNASAGFGDDYEVALTNFLGQPPADEDFSPLDFPGFDLARDVIAAVPAEIPVPPAAALLAGGLLALASLRRRGAIGRP